MSRHSWFRVATLVLGSFVMTGCIDEISQIFEIILYSESDDPEVRETGEVLAELRIEREAAKLVDRFLETSDANDLGGSLSRPWDPPGVDASPEAHQLYADYCATRGRIMTEFDDSLSYIPIPPCP